MLGIRMESNLLNFFCALDEIFEAKYGIPPKAYMVDENILLACSSYPQSDFLKKSNLTRKWEWKGRRIFLSTELSKNEGLGMLI